MPRKLTLRREQLAELATSDLVSVAGGSGACFPTQTIPDIQWTFICPSHDCTGYYPSLNAPCTTE